MLNYLPVLIAFVGGVAGVIQARFNGMMDKGMGTLESVFITYGLGGLVIIGAISYSVPRLGLAHHPTVSPPSGTSKLGQNEHHLTPAAI